MLKIIHHEDSEDSIPNSGCADDTTEHHKPFNLTARYDFNWRRPDKSTYSLWALYDYEHTHYDNVSRAISLSFNSDFVIGNDAIQDKKDVSRKISMGYSGTTQLNRPGWVLKSSADVSLQKRKVKDDWLIDEFPVYG